MVNLLMLAALAIAHPAPLDFDEINNQIQICRIYAGSDGVLDGTETVEMAGNILGKLGHSAMNEQVRVCWAYTNGMLDGTRLLKNR